MQSISLDGSPSPFQFLTTLPLAKAGGPQAGLGAVMFFNARDPETLNSATRLGVCQVRGGDGM